jgi:ubiquinone/menaquinone biosynthesis C-methylase UbiE
MNKEQQPFVCPVWMSRSLDLGLRRRLHDPQKILAPYAREGMAVLDLGCGPGFFTLGLARLVAPSGRVTAADLQEGMLANTRRKVDAAGMTSVVSFHRCGKETIGLEDKFDFVLCFWMLHEVPDQARFLRETGALLKATGRLLVAEPFWHVSRKEFRQSVGLIEGAGLAIESEPKIRFSRAVVARAAKNEILAD